MKKIRFALLAAVVACASFAFTVPQTKKAVVDPVYAFTIDGIYLGTGDYEALDEELCPGDGIFCAQVWTDITPEGTPAGSRVPNFTKAGR